MKLFALYWKEDEDRLDTCRHAWWKSFHALGYYREAAVFTQEAVEELMAGSEIVRKHGVVVDLGDF